MAPEEYLLEIEYEHRDGATAAAAQRPPNAGSASGGVAVRAKALRGILAGRMREAPLVVLFVASVIGFAAFSGLVSFLVTAVVDPGVFVPSAVPGVGAGVDPVWSILMLILLATVAGVTGALLVFWRRLTGWGLLVAYAVWQLVRPYALYVMLVSQSPLAAEALPSFWAFVDAQWWTMLAVRLLFLALLFLPGVVRWVVAPRREARKRARAAGAAALTLRPVPVPR